MAYPNLNAEMKRYGVTQADVAKEVGCTTATVSSWMTGKTPMSVSEAFRVRDAFFPSLPVDYLFSEDPSAPPG